MHSRSRASFVRADLTGDEVDTKNPNLRKAIRDASLSYRKFTSGEAIPEPPTPFQKAGNTVAGLFRREGTDGKEVASR